MIKNMGITIGLAGVLWLVGCIRENKPMTGPGDEKSTGEARLYLPALPKGFLAKIAEDTTHVQFELTIRSGRSIFRIQSWDLNDVTQRAVVISGIPAGAGRIFIGRILSNGVVAYEGADTVTIESGKTADVYLKLVAGSGAASICVEIEGIRPSPWCQRDTVGVFHGCWYVQNFAEDTMMPPTRGELRIKQQGNLVTVLPILNGDSLGIRTGSLSGNSVHIPHMDSGKFFFGEIMRREDSQTLEFHIFFKVEWNGAVHHRLMGTRIQCRDPLPPIGSPTVAR